MSDARFIRSMTCSAEHIFFLCSEYHWWLDCERWVAPTIQSMVYAYYIIISLRLTACKGLKVVGKYKVPEASSWNWEAVWRDLCGVKCIETDYTFNSISSELLKTVLVKSRLERQRPKILREERYTARNTGQTHIPSAAPQTLQPRSIKHTSLPYGVPHDAPLVQKRKSSCKCGDIQHCIRYIPVTCASQENLQCWEGGFLTYAEGDDVLKSSTPVRELVNQ